MAWYEIIACILPMATCLLMMLMFYMGIQYERLNDDNRGRKIKNRRRFANGVRRIKREKWLRRIRRKRFR